MKVSLFLAATAGFVAVAAGAFGAHALSDRLAEQGSEWWNTATLYLLAHAAAGLATARGTSARQSVLFSIGGLVFALPLYALGLGGPSWLGAITPLGGIMMLSGWSWLALASFKTERPYE